MLSKELSPSALVSAMVFIVAAVVVLFVPPAFAQQGLQTTVTGVLTTVTRGESATPVYTITDEATKRPYLLVGTAVALGDYVGQRVALSGNAGPPSLTVQIGRASCTLQKYKRTALP